MIPSSCQAATIFFSSSSSSSPSSSSAPERDDNQDDNQDDNEGDDEGGDEGGDEEEAWLRPKAALCLRERFFPRRVSAYRSRCRRRNTYRSWGWGAPALILKKKAFGGS